MAKSKEQLLTKIDNLLVEINSQYADLKSSNQLEGIEIALLSSNIDYLSSQVKALSYFQQPTVKESNVSEEVELFTPSIKLEYEADEQETFEEIVEQPIVVAAVEQTLEEVQTINTQHNTVSDFVPRIEEPVYVHEPAKIPEPEPVVEPVKEVVMTSNEEVPALNTQEKVTSERPLTINELIQQQKQAGVNMTQQFQTASSQEKAIDLKVAISLNDKLLFIKDLFNGYSLAYSEALELLNRFDNYAEADAFLQTNYALKNGWADKPQTVDKFYALLRKKFN
ncbi:hypothetical protein [Sphingobacterium rhinopitheci]|uniref:hypothetical protein n=1 Tax=Sphingobacterium rhinopitheci TaxID=2781960 RepID=UPI001F525B9F|nr:hypothetical protein [Sphingobacterium rhinopitheci]MCI0920160.1 hypothetical protein [Sphingobacterium rhinopitheci]